MYLGVNQSNMNKKWVGLLSILMLTSGLPLVLPIYVGHVLIIFFTTWFICTQGTFTLPAVLCVLLIIIILVTKVIVNHSQFDLVRPLQFALLILGVIFFVQIQSNNIREEIEISFIFVAVGNCIFLISSTINWIIDNGLVFSNGTDFFRLSGLFNSPIESVVFNLIGLSTVIHTRSHVYFRKLLILFFLGFLVLSFSRTA